MTRYVQKLVTIIRIKFIGSKDDFPKKIQLLISFGMISDSSHTLIMNVLSKTQKMKKHLQEAGLSFPTSVDQGEMINRQSKSHSFNIFTLFPSLRR